MGKEYIKWDKADDGGKSIEATCEHFTPAPSASRRRKTTANFAGTRRDQNATPWTLTESPQPPPTTTITGEHHTQSELHHREKRKPDSSARRSAEPPEAGAGYTPSRGPPCTGIGFFHRRGDHRNS
ncbi:hypothetical protein YC2023_064124 [Brassica napus]